mmetsp:Transcript_28594/g.61483  ORF Transcript_28594/g.61483 Transcript_28594/m.61483 type:complete len:114 (+) Transcript_28594:110-451(+)
MSSPTKRSHPASSETAAAIIESAMAAMTNSTSPALFDVTIICTTDDYQAAYWMERLSNGICKSNNNNNNNERDPPSSNWNWHPPSVAWSNHVKWMESHSVDVANASARPRPTS